MSAESELEQIKSILSQIRDQSAVSAGTGSQSSQDLDQYSRELKLARGELDLLEKGSAKYNRKQREVEKLTRLTRNAMKDQRRETDALSLSTDVLANSMSMLGNALDTVVTKFAGLVKSVFDEAKQLDTLTVQFQAATGASAAMASNIGALTDRLALFGVSNEKAHAAVDSLYKGMTSFSQLNRGQQRQLGATVGLLGELGVSADTSAKILDTSFRALNMSVGESNAMMIDLRGTSKALQIPIEQLTADFSAAESRIVELGSQGPEAFKDISAAAKATGVGVADLLGIVGQFDTFEGATQAAAGLNAVLQGSYFDPLSLMRAENPAEQVELLREGFAAAGVTIEEGVDGLDRFQKKALAKQLGTDVPNLMKLLTGDIEELKGEVEQTTYSFEDMSKEAFGLKGFDSIINNTMQALARPVSQIQQATRATFEGFTPFIAKFQAYNADIIEKTAGFVANNSELVGAAGILYNLAGIDGVQQGYEIFKGIASFTGSILSNLFSVKGVLAVMAAGALYMIKDDFGKIFKAFSQDGIFAGLETLWGSITDGFGRIQNYLDKEFGINKQFLMRGLHLVKQFGLTSFQYLRLHLFGPMYDYVELDLIPKMAPMFEKLWDTVGSLFTKAMNKAMSAGIRSTIGDTGANALKAMGIDIDNMFGETIDEPSIEDGMSIEQKKKYRTMKRKESLMKSQVALDDEMTAFGSTRGAQEAEKRAAKAIKTVTPYITDAVVAAQKAADTTVDVAKSTKDGVIEGMKEFHGAQGEAHKNFQGQLIVDGKVFAEVVTPVSQQNFESNLSKAMK